MKLLTQDEFEKFAEDLRWSHIDVKIPPSPIEGKLLASHAAALIKIKELRDFNEELMESEFCEECRDNRVSRSDVPNCAGCGGDL